MLGLEAKQRLRQLLNAGAVTYVPDGFERPTGARRQVGGWKR